MSQIVRLLEAETETAAAGLGGGKGELLKGHEVCCEQSSRRLPPALCPTGGRSLDRRVELMLCSYPPTHLHTQQKEQEDSEKLLEALDVSHLAVAMLPRVNVSALATQCTSGCAFPCVSVVPQGNSEKEERLEAWGEAEPCQPHSCSVTVPNTRVFLLSVCPHGASCRVCAGRV